MLNFRLYYIFFLSAVICQIDTVAIGSFNSKTISSNLDSLVNANNDLTFSLDLYRISVKEKKIEYEKFYDTKYLDTLVIKSSDQIEQNVLNQIKKPLSRISIGPIFDQRAKNIHHRYYFLQEPIKYKFGLISHERLGGLIQIRPTFQNQFSGLMGMNRLENTWNITGEFNIHFENLLKTAGAYDIYWKRVDSLSQVLKFEFIEPHPFGLPYGINYQYNHEVIRGLYTVIDNQTHLIISAPIFHILRLGISSGKTIPTIKGREQGYSMLSFRSLSLASNYDGTNHRILPSNGYKYLLQLDGGKQNNSGYLEGEYQLSIYLPIKNQSFLKFASQGKSIRTLKGSIPKTRFYYFGGESTLRGYNEQQFFSASYQVTSLELGYRPNPKWQASMFIDYATNIPEPSEINKVGYGIGFTQINSQTIIKVQYAVPGSLDFNNSKLHIKLISRL